MNRETDAIAQRYERRAQDDRYSMLNPDVWHAVHERQRAMLCLLASLGWRDLAQRRVVEVGCGAGGNLLELLRFGFAPEHLTGIELLAQRMALARRMLPVGVQLVAGDATEADIAPESHDIAMQFTVFSSVLDNDAQQRLANAMWRWLKPRGGVLWYDFTIDNPRNRDVRGVPLARVRKLFPQARIQAQRITLAPPLARRLSRWPGLLPMFNALPLLRTHVLAWIEKPE